MPTSIVQQYIVVHSIPYFQIQVPARHYDESEVETIVVHPILVYNVNHTPNRWGEKAWVQG